MDRHQTQIFIVSLVILSFSAAFIGCGGRNHAATTPEKQGPRYRSNRERPTVTSKTNKRRSEPAYRRPFQLTFHLQAITNLLAARLLGQPADSTGASTADEAYAIQGEILKRSLSPNNPPIGYKIAATTTQSQKRLGLTEPASGIITTNMLQRADADLPTVHFPSFIEVEVGLIIGRDIKPDDEGQIETALSINDAISGLCVVIEIPAWRYQANSQTDLI